MMLGRLKGRFAAGQQAFGADAYFYMHEAYEATLMNRGQFYRIAHYKALKRYAVPEMGLYHRNVIRHLHKTEGMFSQAYLDYWGIVK